MLNPEEIIEVGFANLRQEVSRLGLTELSAESSRRARIARIKAFAVGSVGCAVVAGIIGVAFKPTSALAALRESARLSVAQPIVHVRVVNHDTYEHPSIPPAVDDLPIDIWRFPDHCVRRQGHVIKKLFRDGRYLAYDDRFMDGFSGRYDAEHDPTWTLDGTIGPQIARRRTSDLKTETRRTERGEETVYQWGNLDAHQNGITERIHVNRTTNLVDLAEGDLKDAEGRRNHGTCTFEYPDAKTAEREAGDFPTHLRFRTKSELQEDLNRRIVMPEQTKMLEGVRVTLYGVIVYPNTPDGIGIEVLLRGYRDQDSGPGHPVQFVNANLFRSKLSDMSPRYHDLDRAQFVSNRGFNGELFSMATSNELFGRAPSEVTVRVPVWRPKAKRGNTAHSGDFLGYLTFKTNKLFYNIGDGFLPNFGDPRATD